MRRFFGTVEDKFYIPLCEGKAKALSLSLSSSELFDEMTVAEIAGALLIQHIASVERGVNVVIVAERILFEFYLILG